MKNLYHTFGCKNVNVKLTECILCKGSGMDRNQEKCKECNGHGELWNDGSGYAFKKYTLKPCYQ